MRVDDPFQMIALGQLEQFESIYKFGRNRNVGATEVLIAGGGIYGLPTTADTITVTSDNANDVLGGSGARTVHLFGLDADYNEISEIINMGGTSIKEFIRVYRAHVETSGTLTPTLGANIGTLTISQTGGTPMIIISPYDGQTLCACYTLSAETTGLLWSADVTVGEGKSCVNRLKVKEFDSNSPFRTKGIRDAFENSAGIEYKIPRTLPPKSDIVFTTISSSAGTSVSGTFLIQLFKPRG